MKKTNHSGNKISPRPSFKSSKAKVSLRKYPSNSSASKILTPISPAVKIHLRPQVQNLEYVFNPRSVAIVGASANPKKVGHSILRNFLHACFEGKIYPINTHEEEVLGIKAYKKVSEASDSVDCVIIATPANTVYDILRDALKSKIKAAVVISGGFSEVGNKKEELKIKELADKHQIALIGPNCMGILNPQTRNDSIFLPIFKLGRPRVGQTAFISQSGAVGGCIVDLAAKSSIGISKFVSYGNAACINETDLIEYFIQDAQTDSLISYIEGVNDGRRFMRAVSTISRHKPFVVLKAGKSALGSQAALSHTGALAGSYKIFTSAVKQAGAIEVKNLNELFYIAKILQIKKFFSSRIAVLTNGGGNGVLAADAIEHYGLKLANFSPVTLKGLSSFLPNYAQPKNPLDIIGDADASRYEKSLELLIADDSIDAIVVIILFQTSTLDSRIVNVLMQAKTKSTKPIIAVSTGGDYTQLHSKMLDDYGIPTYPSPDDAMSSLSKILRYNIYCHTHQ